MTNTVNDTLSLAATHFKLDPEALDWVSATISRMSWQDKLRQLFCLLQVGDDVAEAESTASFRPGSIFRAPGPDPETAWRATHAAQMSSVVPLLIAGDLEGGHAHPSCLSSVPNALAVAAADDTELTLSFYSSMASEARALGFNWTFGPVVDINSAWRSAIVGTRSYGSDVSRVLRHASAYVRAMQAAGIGCTAKHWPGEGQDDRDQHLVVTHNPQSREEWEDSYGRLYRGLISEGVMSVMPAHISLPAWQVESPGRPASVCSDLTQGLLRERLGFQGLITSDATPMGGLAGWAPRDVVVPSVIAAGCDVMLFSHSPEEDLTLLQRALESGALAESRIDAAVTRQLAMKAALGLHRVSSANASTRVQLDKGQAEEVRVSVQSVARKAVTIVKQAPDVLPIDVKRHRRIVVMEQQGDPMLPGLPEPSIEPLLQALRERGFEPRRHERNTPVVSADTDLLLYVLTQESTLTRSHIQVDWRQLHGDFPFSMLRWWHDVPTIMVSFGHPFHIYEAPQVPTYLNAYSCVPPMQLAVVDAITGASAISGRSPVDMSCGLPASAFASATQNARTLTNKLRENND